MFAKSELEATYKFPDLIYLPVLFLSCYSKCSLTSGTLTGLFFFLVKKKIKKTRRSGTTGPNAF